MRSLYEILQHIHKPMPKEIWSGAVYGPISYDDPFEITFWYKETKDGPTIHGVLNLEAKSIKIVES